MATLDASSGLIVAEWSNPTPSHWNRSHILLPDFLAVFADAAR